MSYIYNNAIKYSDSPNMDAFGRLRTSAVHNLLDIKHVYDKNTLLVNEVTAGTATSVFSQEYARVRMSTSSNNDLVIRQTKTHPIYQPGKSQLFEASFSNFQLESNVIKRVGGFTSTTASTYNSVFDGFFLESNGLTNTISFQLWRSGTTIYSAVTTSWNSTEFDPNNLNWSNTNLMFVDYQWLGVGRMRFGLNLLGQTIYFTEHNCANNESYVYMSSPNQPIRYEIRQVGAGSGNFDMICSQVSTEGALNALFSYVGITHSNQITLNTPATPNGTKYPYIGFRLKQGYKGVNAQLVNSVIVGVTNDLFVITLEFNPTLSSTPVWSGVTDSPIEYSLQDGTLTVSNSGFILKSVVADISTTTSINIDSPDNQTKIGSNINGTMDEMWVCITPLTTDPKLRGSVNLQYYL